MNTPTYVYLVALVGAAVLTAITLPFWRTFCHRRNITDDPGHRKIHSETIPLAGGLASLSGFLIPLFLGLAIASIVPALLTEKTAEFLHNAFNQRGIELAAIILGAIGMLAIGLIDDRFELRPPVKFSAQFLVALGVAASGIRITIFVDSVLFSYFITVFWILTVVNAFNFMDNMNGLCGGLGAIAATYFGLISANYGEILPAIIAFLIAGALIGFLPYNFPKASAFLGDSGSHLVGFLMAVLAILPRFYTTQHPDFFAVLIPLLILAMPLGDLLSVVIIRWQMGKPVYIGDNNHLSHRLVRAGCSQKVAVIIIWSLAALIGALAFLWWR